MAEDVPAKQELRESKKVLASTWVWYLALLPVVGVVEYGYVRFVWLRPTGTHSLIEKACIQLMILGPAFAGWRARTKLRWKLDAGEISPAYASDLSSSLFGELMGVYLTFMLLLGLVRN
jgi:hypothetical protein